MMHVREGLTVKKVAGWILVLLMLAGCAAPKPKPPEERPPEPAPVELQWQVQNPLPSGAAYAGVVVGNGTLVAVGQRGTVLAGPARGGVFTIRPSGTEKDLKAVAFGGNRFVAVGAAGTVVSSLDGVAWAPAASGTDQDLGAVAFGNGRFVAVSRDGAVLTSTDGQTWTKGELPPSPGKVGGLAFGAGLFVVVDEAGRIRTSADGVTWDEAASGTTNLLIGVAYGNGTFVAVANPPLSAPSTFLLSHDGHTWEAVPAAYRAYGVDWAGDRFIAPSYAKGGNMALVSPDGRDWHAVQTRLPVPLTGFAGDGSRYWGAGASGVLATSTDSLAWTIVLPRGTLASMEGVVRGKDRFVAVGGGGTVAYLQDGADWVFPPLDEAGPVLYDAVWAKDQFWGVGTGGIYRSQDGLSWTKVDPGSDRGPVRIAYDEKQGLLVAIDAVGRTFASGDGASWKYGDIAGLPAGGAGPFCGLAAGSGGFAALACSLDDTSASSVYTSADGLHWPGRAQIDPATSLAYGSGRYVVVGAGGAVETSADGKFWERQQSGTTERLFRVAYAGGQFVAFGDREALYSRDGKAWVAGPGPAAGYAINGAAAGAGVVVAVGTMGTILTAQAPTAP
jgi:hypothetical protein